MLGRHAPEGSTTAFLVAESEADVKKRAKAKLLKGYQTVHTDDLYDVDDCLELTEVSGYSVHLEPTNDAEVFEPNNGYHLVPKELVKVFLARE